VGYVANQEQTPETQELLRLMMSLIPAGFAVLTALVTCFYPINYKVEQELEESIRQINKET
jgi:Na+/melibiose symporter-like transporter